MWLHSPLPLSQLYAVSSIPLSPSDHRAWSSGCGDWFWGHPATVRLRWRSTSPTSSSLSNCSPSKTGLSTLSLVLTLSLCLSLPLFLPPPIILLAGNFRRILSVFCMKTVTYFCPYSVLCSSIYLVIRVVLMSLKLQNVYEFFPYTDSCWHLYITVIDFAIHSTVVHIILPPVC